MLLRAQGSVWQPCSHGATPALKVIVCSCETEVPFGRTRPGFYVKVVGFGSVCCFRSMREAKRNGGGSFVTFKPHRFIVFHRLIVLHRHSEPPQLLLVNRVEGEDVIAADADDQQPFVVGEGVRARLVVDGGDGGKNLLVSTFGEEIPERLHLV